MTSRDIQVPQGDVLNQVLIEQHAKFLRSYAENRTGFEQTMVEYLRMSGIYWSAVAMDLMGRLDQLGPKEELIKFISSCQDPVGGGISPSEGHDPHILYTLSALQILAMLDYDLKNNPEQVIDTEKVVMFIKSMQQPDGSFSGDIWGEVDIRFSLCAIASLAILGRLDAIDADLAVKFVLSCCNIIDGGFGARPGAESHAGLIYCALGSLSLLGRLESIPDADALAWWLAERQLPGSGGLNGRPEKLPDLCYSWWVLASLCILGRISWIDRKKLTHFILATQDNETGGFSDRPGNMVDPFHTCFGLAGLSLLAHYYSGSSEDAQQLQGMNCTLKKVNPVLCMAQSVVDKLGIKVQIL